MLLIDWYENQDPKSFNGPDLLQEAFCWGRISVLYYVLVEGDDVR